MTQTPSPASSFLSIGSVWRRRGAVWCLLVLGAVSTLAAQGARPTITLDPDAFADHTAAIQGAITQLAAGQGGKIVFPAGDYLTGPIELENHLTLELAEGATIRLRPGPDGKANGSLFFARNKVGLAIIGAGALEGVPELNLYRQAAPLLAFTACKDIRVEGLTLTHRTGRPLELLECERVALRHLTIYSGHGLFGDRSANLDLAAVRIEPRVGPAFHFARSAHLTLENVGGYSIGKEPVVSLHNTQHVWVHSSAADRGSDMFLQVLGAATRDVRLSDSDLSNTKSAYVIGPDVPPGRFSAL